jgi:recombination protein RecA
MYNEGISATGDLLDLAVEEELVAKRGSFYAYGDIRLGQGRENAKLFLTENPDLAVEIDRVVRERYALPVPGTAARGGKGAKESVAKESVAKESVAKGGKGAKESAVGESAASEASVNPLQL